MLFSFSHSKYRVPIYWFIPVYGGINHPTTGLQLWAHQKTWRGLGRVKPSVCSCGLREGVVSTPGVNSWSSHYPACEQSLVVCVRSLSLCDSKFEWGNVSSVIISLCSFDVRLSIFSIQSYIQNWCGRGCKCHTWLTISLISVYSGLWKTCTLPVSEFRIKRPKSAGNTFPETRCHPWSAYIHGELHDLKFQERVL